MRRYAWFLTLSALLAALGMATGLGCDRKRPTTAEPAPPSQTPGNAPAAPPPVVAAPQPTAPPVVATPVPPPPEVPVAPPPAQVEPPGEALPTPVPSEKPAESATPTPGGDRPTEAAPAAVPVAPAGPRRALQVVAGEGAACARMDDGTVRCWGRGDNGELGTGAQIVDAASPVTIPGVSNSTKLFMGGDPGDSADAICSIGNDGAVTCWGLTRLLPVNAAIEKPEGEEEAPGPASPAALPQQVPTLNGARSIAFGGGSGYAVTADGAVIAWGDGTFNALATGRTRAEPVPVPVPGITLAQEVAAGQNHACARLTDGTVTCWGYVGRQQAPALVKGIAGVVALASGTGTSQTCALGADGVVSCWGAEQTPAVNALVPGTVALAARYQMCAVDGGGHARCWGANDRGQIGDGSTIWAYEPKHLKLLEGVVSIAAGSQFGCAALADGSARCWGLNQRGQLGDGTLSDSTVPVPVSALTAAELPAPADGLGAVQEHATAQLFDTLPPGCTAGPALDVQHPKVKAPFALRSAYARSTIRGTNIVIMLANYAVDPARFLEPPRGNQVALQLRLARLGKAERTMLPITAQGYTTDNGSRDIVYATLYDRSSTPAGWPAGDIRGGGRVEIKALTDEWVCGTLDLPTKSTFFKGTFAARIVK